MNNYPTNPNPGTSREMSNYRTKGNTKDHFVFPANNKFGIPASRSKYGYESDTLDCLDTPFEFNESGRIYCTANIEYSHNAVHAEHRAVKEIVKGKFCIDALVIEGPDLYGNHRTFVVQIKNNYIWLVMEGDTILYHRDGRGFWAKVEAFFKR